MVYKKVVTFRKKKKVSRKKRSMTLSKTPRNILNVKRVYNLTTFTPSTASTAGFWNYYGFQTSSLPDWGQYTSVFDQFRVNALKFTFYPRFTDVNIGSQSQIYATYIIDPQSTILPTGVYSRANLNMLMEQSGVKTRSGNRPIAIYYKPKMADDINAVINSTYSNKWLSTQAGNQIHRGFHIFFHDANFNGGGFVNVSYEIVVTVYMSFKNIK